MKKIGLIFILGWLCHLAPFAQTADKIDFDEVKIKIQEASINSAFSDFGPCIIGTRLYFSSIPEVTKSNKNSNFYKLVVADISPDGKLSNRALFTGLNTKYHQGPIAYCQKTGELFISVSNIENYDIYFNPFQLRKIRLKIVIAKQQDSTWVITGEFPYNNSKYSVGYPAISPDGNKLVFVSDKDGGLGETDLYMSTRENGKWLDPVNLSDKINTKGKEFSPFISSDGTLYFASDGHNENSGLDLYYTSLEELSSPAIRLPKPINSEFDDFDFTLSDDNHFGYFTSARPGTGSDDIYRVDFEMPQKFYEAAVLDSETHEPVANARIIVNDDTKLAAGTAGDFSFEIKKGKKYKVVATAPGYLANSATFAFSDLKKGENTLKGEILLYKEVVEKTFTVNNIYYEYDKWDLLKESEAELDKIVTILKENPDLIIELGSHTDARGTDEYNMKLSQKRSESAVNYIISKGIDASRIIAKGYGESQLVNKCGNNVECTEAEHLQNRRTTFKIINSETGKAVSEKSEELPANEALVPPGETNPGGSEFRIQFFATDKKVDIKKKFPELADAITKYGLIVSDESNLKKYQIGPIKDIIEAETVYKHIKNSDIEALLAEYSGGQRIRIISSFEKK